MIWKVNELSDWNFVASEILKSFPEKKVFALYSEMGTGKTTLTKSLCKILGVKDEAVSPTFSLVNEYDGFEKIYHFDLYRLKNIEELIDIGFEEYISSNSYCFIEWAELALPLLPADTVKIEIELSGAGEERIVTANPS